MDHQVAIAAISAALAFGLLVPVVISQKAMRITLYLVVIPATLSVAVIIAEFLHWYR